MKIPGYKAFGVGLAAAITMLTACNSSDSPGQQGTADYSGVAVKAFSLKEDKNVLNNLDSVFFSIDLANATIFNADSLPVGTKINALAVSMSTDACTVCEFHMTSRNGNDTVVNYLTDPDTHLNFERPVKLKITSYNGTITREYDIKVNVHTVVADSLYWGETERRPLPVAATAQRTVKLGDHAYNLAMTATGAVLSRSTDIYAGRWEQVAGTLPDNPDVASLTAASDALYMLDNAGTLYTSADGTAWTATGQTGWEAISAPYGNGVLGLRTDAGRLMHVAYPAGATSPADPAFPVSGQSQSASLSSEWALAPQVLIVGGVTAGGDLTGAAWAYDGAQWAKVGGGLPAAQGYAMARYTIVETDTLSWQSSRIPALVAIGGRTTEGVRRDVYVSRDLGMTWVKGTDLLQLPEYIPSLWGADMLVFERTATITPKAVKPVTQWEVPTLFLFGGYGTDGALQQYYWQGTINSLRFKPLQ